MLFVRKLRKDYEKYEEIINNVKENQPISIRLADFLNWNKDTNFTIRFDTIATVELQLYGFNPESLYNLDESIRNLDFDKISNSCGRIFMKFSIDDLMNMYVKFVRNGYFGAMVELLIDYPRYVEESCNLFEE